MDATLVAGKRLTTYMTKAIKGFVKKNVPSGQFHLSYF